MANHPTDQNSVLERRATFVRPTGEHDRPTVPPAGRRAAFVAPEQTTEGLEIARRFLQSASRDAAESSSVAARARAGFAAALAEEAVGDTERAAARLTRIRREGAMTPELWATYRRLVKALSPERDQVFDTLVSAARDIDGAAERHLLALDVAREAWAAGKPARDVRAWEKQLVTDNYDGPLTQLHAALLDVDVALDEGDVPSAIAALDVVASDLRLAPHVRSDAAVCRSLYFLAIGEPESALEAFADAARRHHLRADVGESFVTLAAKFGRADLVRTAAEGAALGTASRMVVASYAADAIEAVETARAVLEDSPGDVFTIERAIEWASIEGASTETLIDSLNARLEGTLDDATRVATLCRLGRVYEREAGLEEAAAEIYREALEFDAAYAPALRALGRLYNRRSNWEALADLYEREIAALGDAEGVWRRHFQAADLYATRLGLGEHALDHFRKVLSQKPGYLPALKGAARILEDASQWADLASLFLEAAEAARTRRQKLYLLDKVAEVAETRLHDTDIAIGAWEEILHVDPEHPKAFAALGRLLAGAGRWAELVELNGRELAIIEDSEEASAMMVRNAEICSVFLADDRAAERWYREALDLLPDYLPALEGLGRIFVRGGRWSEVIDMTGAQIHATRDVREQVRQLGALAEILESQLGLEEQAARIHRNILSISPNDPVATDALIRFAESRGNWSEAAELRGSVLATDNRPETRFRVSTSNAHMFEFRAQDRAAAFGAWEKALEARPADTHALAGVVRCANDAGVAPDALASRLEDLMVGVSDSSARDAYFLAVARLREEAEKTPEASRAYRALGDATNLENRIIVACAMALAGEREELTRVRRNEPATSLDTVAGASRTGATDADAEGLAVALEAADHVERAWLLTSADPTIAARYVRAGDPASARLAADLTQVIEGVTELTEPADAHGLRLRAVAAASRNDFETHILLTAREIGAGIADETKVSRWLECAQYSEPLDAIEFVRNAIAVAFADECEIPDGPGFDRLYDTLQALQAWDDLRDAICAHLTRDIGEARRTMLLVMLAELLEDALVDLDGAQFVWEAAWWVDEDAKRLEDIVRVATARGDLAYAIDVQGHRFELAIESGESVVERIQAGLRLAELVEANGEGDQAVHILEQLLHPAVDAPAYNNLQRRLARLHVSHGDPRRAAVLFEKVLPFEANAEVAADWRTLINLYADRLDEPMTAYGLHWKLVRSIPESAQDLDTLVERAWELGELQDCCEQLEEFGRTQPIAISNKLLGRAAEAYDEELQWAEEASRLYEELVKTTDGEVRNNYRRRLAFARSRIAGREAEALESFRQLASDEPFEPTTYRGMLELFERATANDRARVAAQALRALGCQVDREELRAKTVPSRQLDPGAVSEHAIPVPLHNGVFEVLTAAAPLAEKVWDAELPQRKALAGERVREGVLYDRVSDALSLFGIRRFRLMVGEAGPMTPQVFPDSTPTIWMNRDLVEDAAEQELRFWAGWSAALAWSGLGAIIQLDGRQLWHMCEGAWLKQTGKGFTDRVDAESQRMAEEVGGALLTVMRRRLTQAIEETEVKLGDVACESWPTLVETFAARIGLLMAGNISAALTATLSARGWSGDICEPSTQKRVRRDAVATDVLRFALTDSYLHLRHNAGLSGPPSRLDVR